LGRPSIAPERLLRALLLQILYTIRSERLLMEQLDYNLLFRWFVGLNMDDGVWDATVFSKNRDRMLKSDIAGLFFQAVVGRSAGHEPTLRRTLFCGRHINRGMGEPKRVSRRKMTGGRERRVMAAMSQSISMVSGGRTKHTNRRRIPMHDSTKRGKAKRPSSATPVMW
jgi:Transposase domain (DUF772)